MNEFFLAGVHACAVVFGRCAQRCQRSLSFQRFCLPRALEMEAMNRRSHPGTLPLCNMEVELMGRNDSQEVNGRGPNRGGESAGRV
jgi:hypothetical protein